MGAKAKLKQMQKSGALQAPPRRAASLTAAAMVHFMYDEQQLQPTKPTNIIAKNTSGSTTGTTPENVQKAKPKSRDSSEEKTLSTKKNKNEKSRQITTSQTSSDSSSEDEKPTKSTLVKSAAKRPKTPTKAKQPVKKGAK